MRDTLTRVGWFFSGLFTRSKKQDAARRETVKREIEELRAQVQANRGESKRILSRCEELAGVTPGSDERLVDGPGA